MKRVRDTKGYAKLIQRKSGAYKDKSKYDRKEEKKREQADITEGTK